MKNNINKAFNFFFQTKDEKTDELLHKKEEFKSKCLEPKPVNSIPWINIENKSLFVRNFNRVRSIGMFSKEIVFCAAHITLAFPPTSAILGGFVLGMTLMRSLNNKYYKKEDGSIGARTKKQALFRGICGLIGGFGVGVAVGFVLLIFAPFPFLNYAITGALMGTANSIIKSVDNKESFGEGLKNMGTAFMKGLVPFYGMKSAIKTTERNRMSLSKEYWQQEYEKKSNDLIKSAHSDFKEPYVEMPRIGKSPMQQSRGPGS